MYQADGISIDDPVPEVRDGYAAAQAFKFYRQFAPGYPAEPVPCKRVAARKMYKNHGRAFDRLADFFRSHGMDARGYLRFMAAEVALRESDIDGALASKWGLNRFAEKLSAEDNRRKIYEWYSRSVKAVAEACLDSECSSTAEFLRKLIKERRLAPWVVGGRISAYYLAAIPGFPKIVSRLDRISRDELSGLSERYDMYNTAVNDAVRAFERRRANPVRATDEMIERIRSERRAAGPDLFDDSI